MNFDNAGSCWAMVMVVGAATDSNINAVKKGLD